MKNYYPFLQIKKFKFRNPEEISKVDLKQRISQKIYGILHKEWRILSNM